MRKFLSTLGAGVLVAAAVAPYLHAQRPATDRDITQAVVDGRAAAAEVLIQFRPGASASDQRNARAEVNARRKELLHADRAGEIELAEVPVGLPLATAIAVLSRNPAVSFAEPNWVYEHMATSNDPYFIDGSLWGMSGPNTVPSNSFGSRAAEAWASDKTGSSTVVVGVIDEGINNAHEDLGGNIWTNQAEVAGNGIDDDGNGFVDDIHGWDFVNNDNSIYDGTGTQLSVDAHGTHVSGTIGGEGGNGKGVVGVNWHVKIISAKFLGTNGGTTANAIKAVDYITNLKIRHGLNVVATNNSWGGGGFSQGLLDAIVRAANQNILFIAAAGNSGSNNDTTTSYPSNYDTTATTSTSYPSPGYDSVIAVAALCGSSSSYCPGGGGTLASFSSYGATKVDLAAPGVGVYSSTPGNNYSSYNGTSMATPHVTGAAALYASQYLDEAGDVTKSAAQIKQAILSTTTATPALAGKVATGGRLNVCALVGATGCTTAPTLPPDAPNNLTANASGADVNLSWNSSVTATSYGVFRSTISGGPYSQIGSTPNTTYKDTLAASGTYFYVVRAVNSGGSSGNSNQASASPVVPGPPVPVAPTGLTVTVPKGKKQLSLSWTSSSGATNYGLYICSGTCGTASVPPFSSLGGSVTTTSTTITGLQSGLQYSFYVKAVNSAGSSSPSGIASGTPR